MKEETINKRIKGEKMMPREEILRKCTRKREDCKVSIYINYTIEHRQTEVKSSTARGKSSNSNTVKQQQLTTNSPSASAAHTLIIITTTTAKSIQMLVQVQFVLAV